MERTAWTDERIDDAFMQLRDELRAGFADIRAEMRAGFGENQAEHRSIRSEIAQLKVAMLAGYAAIIAALIATSA
jgi:ribosomal protein L29